MDGKGCRGLIQKLYWDSELAAAAAAHRLTGRDTEQKRGNSLLLRQGHIIEGWSEERQFQ